MSTPSVMDQAKERVRSFGMAAWQRPKNAAGEPLDPRLPADLTRLTPEALGRLHGEFAAALQWAKGAHAIMSVEEAEDARKATITRAKAYLLAEGNRETRAALVEVDSGVTAISEKAAVSAAAQRLSYAVYIGYEIGRDVVSREITRRSTLENGRGVDGDVTVAGRRFK